MSKRNLLLAAVSALSMSPLAQAALTINLQLVGGGTSAALSTIGQVVNVEVYASLPTAVNANTLTGLSGGFLSTGSTLGNYTSAIAVTGFDGIGHQDTNGPTFIIASDRDGDTDLDIGGPTAGSATNWFAARAPSAVSGNNLLLGTLSWQVTSLGAANSTTSLGFLIRANNAAASFVENGIAKNGASGNILAGTGITLTVANLTPAAVPQALVVNGSLGSYLPTFANVVTGTNQFTVTGTPGALNVPNPGAGLLALAYTGDDLTSGAFTGLNSAQFFSSYSALFAAAPWLGLDSGAGSFGSLGGATKFALLNATPNASGVATFSFANNTIPTGVSLVRVAAVPEPTSVVALAGIAAVGLLRRRRSV